LLISRLQSYRRQNALTRALQEYGRLIKTIFILRYLESEQLRGRINTQFNKGEPLRALREFLLTHWSQHWGCLPAPTTHRHGDEAPVFFGLIFLTFSRVWSGLALAFPSQPSQQR
jgi:hypothetical protein